MGFSDMKVCLELCRHSGCFLSARLLYLPGVGFSSLQVCLS